MGNITLERVAYSVAEVAKLTGCGRDKIYTAIKAGALDARKWGRRTVITADSLRRFVSHLPPVRLDREA